ncbi:MAG TPA: ankyrin repeat domain-containing protein [Chloroflexia bacterium]|jgi:ankyrin repeat protein
MQTVNEISPEVIEQFVIAAHGNEDLVREMHAQQPYLVNVTWDKFNETPLQAASHMGNRSIARYLISQGAHPDITTHAMLGDAEQVARCLEADPEQVHARGAHGISLMYHAALSGKPEVAELIVSHGGGEGIDEALHAAVNFGHVDMVRWLLENGVQNVNAPNYDKKTPLSVALANGHTEIADLLRERGGTE